MELKYPYKPQTHVGRLLAKIATGEATYEETLDAIRNLPKYTGPPITQPNADPRAVDSSKPEYAEWWNDVTDRGLSGDTTPTSFDDIVEAGLVGILTREQRLEVMRAESGEE